MKRLVLALSMICMMYACNRPAVSSAAKDTLSPAEAVAVAAVATREEEELPDIDDNMAERFAWVRDSVEMYIDVTGARLKDTALDWYLDGLTKRDNVCFVMVPLGHTATEDDGFSPRFSKNAWIFIDTASKAIFEYDLPADSLVRWHRP